MSTVLFYIFIKFSNILVFTIVCNIIRPRLMNVLNLGIISLCWSLDVMNPFLSPQLKKFWKIQLKSKLSLGIIYGLAFGFKQHLIFQRAEFRKPVLYSFWLIFMAGIVALSTKTNQGRFYFILGLTP